MEIKLTVFWHMHSFGQSKFRNFQSEVTSNYSFKWHQMPNFADLSHCFENKRFKQTARFAQNL